jgi:hypothetical protein
VAWGATLKEVYHQSPITPSTRFFFFLPVFIIFIVSNDFARVLLVFAIALL